MAPDELKDDDDLIMLGLDSIRVMRLMSELRAGGMQVSFAELFVVPTAAAWWVVASGKLAGSPHECAPKDYVPLEMTRAEYDALPHSDSLPPWNEQGPWPVGTIARVGDLQTGHIRMAVKGADMFAHQWDAGRNVPAVGLRYFRPVITDAGSAKA
jgi:aryl carrier-like protein